MKGLDGAGDWKLPSIVGADGRAREDAGICNGWTGESI
jgi:hypothetical protein